MRCMICMYAVTSDAWEPIAALLPDESTLQGAVCDLCIRRGDKAENEDCRLDVWQDSAIEATLASMEGGY
jgi:hypothetical protein